MLLLGSSFGKFPLLSLRTGTIVGSIVGHLINPHKLRVDALWCKVGGFKQPKLLLVQDIREVSPRGVIIDDHEILVDPEDVIRLKAIIDLQFDLIDKKVISGRLPIGKVADYALEGDGFIIQKIYVEPNIWNKIKTSRLTIDRSQIIEVSHRYVKVKSADIKEKSESQGVLRQSRLSSSPASSASVTDE